MEEPKIQDYWSSVVLALATTGGIILDVSRRKHQIIISAITSNDFSKSGELDFQTFTVSTLELNKVLAEATEFQQQVESMVEQVDKEKKEEKEREDKKTKTRTARVSKAVEKKMTKRVFPPVPHNLPDDACSVDDPLECDGDVIDYDNDGDKIG